MQAALKHLYVDKAYVQSERPQGYVFAAVSRLWTSISQDSAPQQAPLQPEAEWSASYKLLSSTSVVCGFEENVWRIPLCFG